MKQIPQSEIDKSSTGNSRYPKYITRRLLFFSALAVLSAIALTIFFFGRGGASSLVNTMPSKSAACVSYATDITFKEPLSAGAPAEFHLPSGKFQSEEAGLDFRAEVGNQVYTFYLEAARKDEGFLLLRGEEIIGVFGNVAYRTNGASCISLF